MSTTAAAPTSAAKPAPTEIDFGFDVDTIAALIGRLTDADRKELYRKLDIRPAPKRRSQTAATEEYRPNTGDPRIDAFMTEHHDPKWKPKAIPKPASPKGPAPSTIAAFEAAAAARLRDRGYTVERDGYGGWTVSGGDGSYERQLTAAYVKTPNGWKHPDDVAEDQR